MVCFGFKWADEREARCLTASSRALRRFDDKALLVKASRVFAEADLVVAHYGSIFDRRFIQGRLLINGLPPIPPTKMRDTCMIARSVANFSSNRLGHLSNLLRLKSRKHNKQSGSEWPGWWFRVMQGDTAALADMAEYCKQDVLALEALYERLKPFDNAHPRLVMDRTSCGICGGEIEYRGYAYIGPAPRRYRRFFCRSCRRWDRERRAA